ncbi:ATP-binding protein [Streptomyces sp. NPDC000351]|uniref:ATP-binding protein n=1 Tax=Streptomyces sp. NPDC000351 TaxID=3154250 RepID=UPI003318962C
MSDSATLIVSELVTNAIKHSGGSQVAFRMQLQEELLYLAVESSASGKPAVRETDNDAEHGRGLQLVEYAVFALDGIWGVSDDGATVWCLLPAMGEDQ